MSLVGMNFFFRLQCRLAGLDYGPWGEFRLCGELHDIASMTYRYCMSPFGYKSLQRRKPRSEFYWSDTKPVSYITLSTFGHRDSFGDVQSTLHSLFFFVSLSLR
jgi:hypothetical protein